MNESIINKQVKTFEQNESIFNLTATSTELLNVLIRDLERLTERINELEKRLNKPKCMCKTCVS